MPETVAAAAQLACLLEASAEKPGNVTPAHAFHDMSYEDFLRSAVAIGPELARAGERGVGATVLAAILATRRWTRANTNLGIVLLLTPLARAALLDGRKSLRANLQQVLADLTVEDARDAYRAIRLAGPGGLETEKPHDIRAEPVVTFRAAMASAVERDNIAAEYLSDYAFTFERGLPALTQALARGAGHPQAIIHTYLELLAAVPDTLISRKNGLKMAQVISAKAAVAQAAGGVFSEHGRQAIIELDKYLRSHPDNALNPGTTADLVAAVLFVALLEGVI